MSFKSLVLMLVCAGLMLGGGLAVFQNSLIYFPENPSRQEVLADARQRALKPWPDENDYRGLLREAETKARGTLVLFHGNAGRAGQREDYARQLTRLGLRVILAEYPAYGSRPGELGEAALVADAATMLALARQQFSGPLLLAGESLGAGVAAAVARKSEVDALLLITPWDSIANVAAHHYPWLPASLLLRDRYDSVANLHGFRGRLAVVIAEHDEVVPAQLGRRLYDSAAAPKRLWVVPGAGHNDWTSRIDASWWASVIEFLTAEKS